MKPTTLIYKNPARRAAACLALFCVMSSGASGQGADQQELIGEADSLELYSQEPNPQQQNPSLRELYYRQRLEEEFLELQRIQERQQEQQQRQSSRQQDRQRQRREWRVRAVEFRGNDTYSAKELISLMELKPKWPGYKIRYTNFLMNSDLDAIRTFYRSRGFERAGVKLNRVDRDTLSRRVRIRIDIYEGPRIHVGEVEIVSDTAKFKVRSQAMRRMRTKPGAPLVLSDVSQDSRRLKENLGNRGFLAATVEPDLLVDTAENLARVAFNVTEGPKAAVGGIELEGNTGMKNVVVSRELTFRLGDTLNLRTVQHSERRLYATGLFNFVQIKPLFDTSRAATDLPDSAYNVQVRVSPAEFFSLQSGIGYSTDEGARASASATYRNMFRLGHGLTLGGKVSQISQSAEAVYAMPWFLYLPLQFDTKLYYDRYNNAELYQGSFNGLRLSLGRQTDYNFLYQGWTQWEQVEWIRAPAEDAGPAGIPDYPTQSIGGDVSYDARNDLFNPTKGGYAHVGLEVAGIFGGNSNQFVKATADTRVYFSRRSRYFLSMAARTGYAIPYGQSEFVPVQSKFYGGGGSTVRGFGVNRLAVLPNNDPLKGNFYVFLNIADIRFPIYWWINGAVFLDAGNVWPEFTEVKSISSFFDDLRWAAGPGLRVDTPIKLVVRLDLGFKIDRRPEESRMELHFDLGQPF